MLPQEPEEEKGTGRTCTLSQMEMSAGGIVLVPRCSAGSLACGYQWGQASVPRGVQTGRQGAGVEVTARLVHWVEFTGRHMCKHRRRRMCMHPR